MLVRKKTSFDRFDLDVTCSLLVHPLSIVLCLYKSTTTRMVGRYTLHIHISHQCSLHIPKYPSYTYMVCMSLNTLIYPHDLKLIVSEFKTSFSTSRNSKPVFQQADLIIFYISIFSPKHPSYTTEDETAVVGAIKAQLPFSEGKYQLLNS